MDIAGQPWTKRSLPKRILAIRLQAMGDVVITLPYLQDLRNNLPAPVQIDLLTRDETDPIPRNLILFNKIFSIKGKRNFKKQFIYTILLLPTLLFRRYDIVIDLQNNKLSQLVRKTLKPSAWVEFDKDSPLSAGERNRRTIEAVGIGTIGLANKLHLKSNLNAKEILIDNGWDPRNNLVVLNPAAVFETRNWPIDHYVSFAKMWMHEFPQTQFLIIGLPFIVSKADELKKHLGGSLVIRVGKTSAAQEFQLLLC